MLVELIFRNQVPLTIRVLLIAIILGIVLLFSVNRNWINSLSALTLIPFEKFGWQSDKLGSNSLLRLSSFITTSVCISALIYTYDLTKKAFPEFQGISSYGGILIVLLILSTFKYFFNIFYFKMHKHSELGDKIIDYQYSINQLFAFISGLILIIDVFYLKLHSSLFLILIGLAGLYFLLRLFGTILILQNKFEYPTLTLFVYLCTLEIVPALVVVKVLFVYS